MKKIILIDDEQDFIDLLSALLGFHNYSVTSFSDPKLALATLDSGDYDLLVCDLMMPGLSGFEVLEHLKAKSQRKPIIVLSAKILSDGERRFLLENQAQFLTKPFEPEVLVNLILKLVE